LLTHYAKGTPSFFFRNYEEFRLLIELLIQTISNFSRKYLLIQIRMIYLKFN
jgi:hypothetical protein